MSGETVSHSEEHQAKLHAIEMLEKVVGGRWLCCVFKVVPGNKEEIMPTLELSTTTWQFPHSMLEGVAELLKSHVSMKAEAKPPAKLDIADFLKKVEKDRGNAKRVAGENDDA